MCVGGVHEVIVTKKQVFNFMVEFGSKFYCEEVMLKQGCFATECLHEGLVLCLSRNLSLCQI